MDPARQLLEEARRDNERRLLVFSGSPAHTREMTQDVLDTVDIPPGETTVVGSSEGNRGETFHCEQRSHNQASQLLGTTRSLVVLDLHERCEPNTLGQLVGAVDGGGLFVLRTPPLAEWADKRDEFDETLAVPPFEVADVTGHFRTRLVETLRTHRGIALVDADSGDIERDGLGASPRPRDTDLLAPPSTASFPDGAYEHCLTADQGEALSTLESLREEGSAVVIEANRGRGKSSAAGLAATSLATEGADVLVTGPQYRSIEQVFERARDLLDTLDVPFETDSEANPHRLDTPEGWIRYRPPLEATGLPDDPDCLIVDEAASLPVGVLAETLDASRVAYVTTTHGYEGAGRGFSVRFRDRLKDGPHEVFEYRLSTPIRYAGGDPVEVWAFRALALDASPPVDDILADATPESVTYRELSSEQLLADETLLNEVFGLLVLAHYRTEPNDLARLLDAPNVSVHGLFEDGHPVCVALLAREGGLTATDRERIYDGSRIRGNLIPDVLTSQLRDEDAGDAVGYRVMRIATQNSVRSRGLGSRLLDELTERFSEGDWLGVGYGATPELVEFWTNNGFSPVHLSTTRNDRSGEHSVIMLNPLSETGTQLLARHTRWLLGRLPGTLPDALDDVDPDVIRAVCDSIPATPEVDLTDWEWRHAASVDAGPGIFEMAPRPIRVLAFTGIVDEDGPDFSAREQRLLVRRVLQLHARESVATELGFDSGANCMRELGRLVGQLLDAYTSAWVDEERERLCEE
jgi:tRNA(Met) cytidine acetyltransferase